jgi:RHS repeat-associated protein
MQVDSSMTQFATCASRSTGKERDTESGNDYFDARYYASSMGRFMSPDWSAKEEPVPYAKLDNPQSLNLYSYMRNNPLGGIDADGHWGCNGSTDGFCNPQVLDNIQRGMSAGDAYAGWQAQQQQSSQNTSATSDNKSNAIYNAFALGAQYGEKSIGPNDSVPVSVRHVGFTDNVQIRGDTLDEARAGGNGWQDPLTSFHSGADSYYFGDLLFNTGHVAAGAGENAPPGLEAHYDRLGPLNPLHWVEAALSLVINTRNSGVAQPYTCSLSGGCAAQ